MGDLQRATDRDGIESDRPGDAHPIVEAVASVADDPGDGIRPEPDVAGDPATPEPGQPAPAPDPGDPDVRRIIVRPAAAPSTRGHIGDRRPGRRPAVPLLAPLRGNPVGQTAPAAAASAPILLTDLRVGRLRPVGDRFIGWLTALYRAIVALGVRSLVHPIAIVGYAMIAGILLRTFRITTNPPGLNQDEALAGYDAWSLWQTLRDHHGNTLPIAGFLSFGDWVSPFLSFYLAPIVGIFGLDVMTVRIGTVLLGVAAIPLTYLLTVELTGRRGTGAAAACFLAISPWAVHLSRFAIPPATVLCLFPLALWLVLRAIRLRTTASVILAALALSLAMLGYPTLKLYFPLVGGLIAVVYLREWLLIPARTLSLGFLTLAITSGPNFLFSFRSPDASNRQRFISIFNRDDVSPGLLAEQYWSYINPHYLFVNRNENDSADAASRFTTELSWTIPFLVIGAIAVAIRAFRPETAIQFRRPALLIAGLTVLAPVPGMFTTIQNGSRETQLIVLFAIVCGIGLVTLGDVVHRALRRLGGSSLRPAAVALTVIVVLAPLGGQARDRYHGYYQDYPLDYGVQRYFHTGLIDAAEYAWAVQDDYDTIWFVDTNQGYIVFLLANQVDPNLVHNELEISGQDFGSYLVDGIGKFRFNGVYVGLDDDVVVLNQRVVFESFPFGNGRGYVARAGKSPDGSRILVISSEVR